MASPSVKLFLSCVSAEFGVYRDALRRALTRPNVEIKIQEDFKALGRDTLHMLDKYIEQCEAVVHFVGDMTGAAPAPVSVSACSNAIRNSKADWPRAVLREARSMIFPIRNGRPGSRSHSTRTC
jgi:hypothetical protein